MLQVQVKAAVNDVAPSHPKRKPFIYWEREPEHDCCRHLVDRSEMLQAHARAMEDGSFVRKFARPVYLEAKREKDAQIRYLRELFLYNPNPAFQLARNVMARDKHNGPMELSSNTADLFDSVAELRACLLRDTMHANPEMYHLFCSALESGKMRGMKARAPAPLERMLTIAFEAFFRLELGSALTSQGYRWPCGKDGPELRKRKFKEMMITVKLDRRENGGAAWKRRQKDIKESELGTKDVRTKATLEVEADDLFDNDDFY